MPSTTYLQARAALEIAEDRAEVLRMALVEAERAWARSRSAKRLEAISEARDWHDRACNQVRKAADDFGRAYHIVTREERRTTSDQLSLL